MCENVCVSGDVLGCEGECECVSVYVSVGCSAGAGTEDSICLEVQSLPLLESFWLGLSCRCGSAGSPHPSDL